MQFIFCAHPAAFFAAGQLQMLCILFCHFIKLLTVKSDCRTREDLQRE